MKVLSPVPPNNPILLEPQRVTNRITSPGCMPDVFNPVFYTLPLLIDITKQVMPKVE